MIELRRVNCQLSKWPVQHKGVLLLLAALILLSASCTVPLPTSELLPPPSQDQLVRAAQQIAGLTARDGGATYNLYDGNLRGQEVYAVAIAPEREEEVDGYPGSGRVHDFIQRNMDVLRYRTMHVGTWYNEALGRSYLEISTTVPDLKQALKLARAHDQQSVYDLRDHKEILVVQPSTAAAH